MDYSARRVALVSRPVNVASVANVDDDHHTWDAVPCSGIWRESKEFVSDRGCRSCAVEGNRAVLEHMGLEKGPAVTDLLAARFAAARWMQGIVGHEPGLLCRFINTEQEHPVEKIQKFVLVPGNAADEHWFPVPGQDF